MKNFGICSTYIHIWLALIRYSRWRSSPTNLDIGRIITQSEPPDIKQPSCWWQLGCSKTWGLHALLTRCCFWACIQSV